MSDTPELQAPHEDPTTPDHESAQSPPAEPAPTEPAPAEPAPTEPADLAPPLATLIATIRAGVARGAFPEARAAGATACRSILTVLDVKPGQPLAAAPPPPTSSAASPIAGLLSQPGFLAKLAAMSREQLIELVKQVTGAMPATTQSPATAAPRFHLIQLPQVRRPGSGS
jgi:hypothetical protein